MATSFEGSGAGLTGIVATDSSKLPLAGGTMTGTLTSTAGLAITATGDAYLATGTGKVGIGTTTPQTLLSLAKNNTIGLATTSSADDGYLVISAAGADDSTRGSRISMSGVNRATYGGVLELHAGTTGAKNIISLSIGNSEKFRVDNAGNVGIGTTSPTRTLEVAGIIMATSFEGSGAGLTGIVATDSSKLPLAGGTMTGTLTVDAAGGLIVKQGSVGIGTTSPNSTLDLGTSGILTIGMNSSLHSSGSSVKISGNSGREVSLLTSTDTPGDRNGLSFIKTRGTVTAPTAVVSGDLVGFFGFKGSDGTTTPLTGLIQGYVDGTVSTGVVPMAFDLITGTTGANRLPRLTIRSTGNVGIGTTNPTRTFEVAGIVKATSFEGSGAGLTGINATDSSKLPLAGGTLTGTLTVDAAGANLIVYQGKAGIGTTAPGARLHAADPNFPVIRAERTGLTTDGGVWATISALATKTSKANDNFGSGMLSQFQDTGGTFSLGGVGFVRNGGDYKGKFVVQNNTGTSGDIWSQNFVVTSAGNAGIGTTEPAAKLHAYGSGSTSALVESADNYSVLQLKGGQSGDVTWALMSGYPNAGDFTVRQAGVANYLTIKKDTGNVGIGTTAPGAILEVDGPNYPVVKGVRTSSDTNSIKAGLTSEHKTTADMTDGFGTSVGFNIQDSAGVSNVIGTLGAMRDGADNSGALYFQLYTAGTPNERMRLTNGGNLGIGTTSPALPLHVVKTAGTSVREQMIKFNTTDAGNDAGYIGNATAGDGSFVATFSGYTDSSAAQASFQLRSMTSAANDATDSSTFGMLDLAAFRTDSATDPNNGNLTAIANRKLLTVRGGTAASDIRLAILANGNVGIGTTGPGYVLDVQHASSKVNSKNGYLTNGADYAEYFENEENIPQGSVAGLDLSSGKARRYQPGDELLGIVSDGKGYIGNGNKEIENDPRFTLVGLLGQLKFNLEEVIVKDRIVYTQDNIKLGVLLSNGKIFVRR
jgi:hypothetical protein